MKSEVERNFRIGAQPLGCRGLDSSAASRSCGRDPATWTFLQPEGCAPELV